MMIVQFLILALIYYPSSAIGSDEKTTKVLSCTQPPPFKDSMAMGNKTWVIADKNSSGQDIICSNLATSDGIRMCACMCQTNLKAVAEDIEAIWTIPKYKKCGNPQDANNSKIYCYDLTTTDNHRMCSCTCSTVDNEADFDVQNKFDVEDIVDNDIRKAVRQALHKQIAAAQPARNTHAAPQIFSVQRPAEWIPEPVSTTTNRPIDVNEEVEVVLEPLVYRVQSVKIESPSESSNRLKESANEKTSNLPPIQIGAFVKEKKSGPADPSPGLLKPNILVYEPQSLQVTSNSGNFQVPKTISQNLNNEGYNPEVEIEKQNLIHSRQEIITPISKFSPNTPVVTYNDAKLVEKIPVATQFVGSYADDSVPFVMSTPADVPIRPMPVQAVPIISNIPVVENGFVSSNIPPNFYEVTPQPNIPDVFAAPSGEERKKVSEKPVVQYVQAYSVSVPDRVPTLIAGDEQPKFIEKSVSIDITMNPGEALGLSEKIPSITVEPAVETRNPIEVRYEQPIITEVSAGQSPEAIQANIQKEIKPEDNHIRFEMNTTEKPTELILQNTKDTSESLTTKTAVEETKIQLPSENVLLVEELSIKDQASNINSEVTDQIHAISEAPITTQKSDHRDLAATTNKPEELRIIGTVVPEPKQAESESVSTAKPEVILISTAIESTKMEAISATTIAAVQQNDPVDDNVHEPPNTTASPQEDSTNSISNSSQNQQITTTASTLDISEPGWSSPLEFSLEKKEPKNEQSVQSGREIQKNKNENDIYDRSMSDNAGFKIKEVFPSSNEAIPERQAKDATLTTVDASDSKTTGENQEAMVEAMIAEPVNDPHVDNGAKIIVVGVSSSVSQIRSESSEQVTPEPSKATSKVTVDFSETENPTPIEVTSSLNDERKYSEILHETTSRSTISETIAETTLQPTIIAEEEKQKAIMIEVTKIPSHSVEADDSSITMSVSPSSEISSLTQSQQSFEMQTIDDTKLRDSTLETSTNLSSEQSVNATGQTPKMPKLTAEEVSISPTTQNPVDPSAVGLLNAVSDQMLTKIPTNESIDEVKTNSHVSSEKTTSEQHIAEVISKIPNSVESEAPTEKTAVETQLLEAPLVPADLKDLVDSNNSTSNVISSPDVTKSEVINVLPPDVELVNIEPAKTLSKEPHIEKIVSSVPVEGVAVLQNTTEKIEAKISTQNQFIQESKLPEHSDIISEKLAATVNPQMAEPENISTDKPVQANLLPLPVNSISSPEPENQASPTPASFRIMTQISNLKNNLISNKVDRETLNNPRSGINYQFDPIAVTYEHVPNNIEQKDNLVIVYSSAKLLHPTARALQPRPLLRTTKYPPHISAREGKREEKVFYVFPQSATTEAPTPRPTTTSIPDLMLSRHQSLVVDKFVPNSLEDVFVVMPAVSSTVEISSSTSVSSSQGENMTEVTLAPVVKEVTESPETTSTSTTTTAAPELTTTTTTAVAATTTKKPTMPVNNVADRISSSTTESSKTFTRKSLEIPDDEDDSDESVTIAYSSIVYQSVPAENVTSSVAESPAPVPKSTQRPKTMRRTRKPTIALSTAAADSATETTSSTTPTANTPDTTTAPTSVVLPARPMNVAEIKQRRQNQFLEFLKKRTKDATTNRATVAPPIRKSSPTRVAALDLKKMLMGSSHRRRMNLKRKGDPVGKTEEDEKQQQGEVVTDRIVRQRISSTDIPKKQTAIRRSNTVVRTRASLRRRTTQSPLV